MIVCKRQKNIILRLKGEGVEWTNNLNKLKDIFKMFYMDLYMIESIHPFVVN